MSHASRLAALGAGALAFTMIGIAPSASAATTATLRLHGSMYARKAMATAKITQTSPGDYRIQITASGLPAPDMIHAMPKRHAYLAWTVNSMDKHAMMGVLPLIYNKSTGVYTANRVVMMKEVTRIFITADKSAMQHMPTMPEITVLDSASKSGM